MQPLLAFVIFAFSILQCWGLLKTNTRLLQYVQQKSFSLNGVPLELSGQLDPSKKWEVTLKLNGVEKKVTIGEDTSFLEAAEKNFDDAPYSCRNGVCTTCAAKVYLLFLLHEKVYSHLLLLHLFQVVEGNQNVLLAVHGLGKPQIDAGYICSCQGYATGPGVVIQLGCYDEVYESQYGQYEKSYGELKYTKK
jgi:hypothetical protein